VGKDREIGADHDASTYGGGLLCSYSFGEGSGLEGVSLPFRLEYISSTGTSKNGAPNLMYGAGSDAWSLTFTPTYQYKLFFVRPEISYVGASNTASGSAFGKHGNDDSQFRFLFEGGVIF
jgi:hypothetical protein